MSSSLRIAIADDEPGTRESLQQMLSDLGHKVIAVAENGESLIEQCAMTEPDVVITGTLTPKMHGSDAAATIYNRRPIPIILYSGHCEPELVINAEHKHVFMYLAKPICQEYLQAALKECRAELIEPEEGDAKTIAVGASSRASTSALYREHHRPPYRQLPR